MKNYCLKSQQPYGSLGLLDVKFLNQSECSPMPALLLKLDPSNWAIVTPCTETFASALPNEQFGIHVEKAIFTATKTVEEGKAEGVGELKQVSG